MEKITEKDWDSAISWFVKVIKYFMPDLTDERAENLIVNVGNEIQLRRLDKKNET